MTDSKAMVFINGSREGFVHPVKPGQNHVFVLEPPSFAHVDLDASDTTEVRRELYRREVIRFHDGDDVEFFVIDGMCVRDALIKLLNRYSGRS